MKELQYLLHELRCDINYCKVGYENDTEIDNANETLLKVQDLVKNLTIPVVSNWVAIESTEQPERVTEVMVKYKGGIK